MRKSIIISPSAANDIKECVRQAMIFTGFETSGIRLQDAIIDKIESYETGSDAGFLLSESAEGDPPTAPMKLRVFVSV